MKAYLSMTVALAIGHDIALGSFVLNHIYKEMNDLITFNSGKLNGTTRGQIRMVHIWITVYCPNIFDWKSLIVFPSTSICAPCIAKASCDLKSFQRFFSYFYETVKEVIDARLILPQAIDPA